ncbi:MAG: hypothetical protein AAGA20_17775 [Planctomycetota bacterium]
MIGFVRQLFAFALAAAITWWLLFRAPAPSAPAPVQTSGPVSLRPIVETAFELADLEDPLPPPPEPEPEPPVEVPVEEPELPPDEAGSREGTEEGEAAEDVPDPVPEAEAETAPRAAETEAKGAKRTRAAELMRDDELLDAAASELAGEAAIGFTTRIYSSPEEELEIARAFGEEIVLVPTAAKDTSASDVVSYRLDLSGTPRVVTVSGIPPRMMNTKRTRDFLQYDFSSLPKPLRELRTSIPRRDEIWVFAALIPVEEWAIVVGRRREAAEALGVAEEDVERYDLRYVRTPEGEIDIVVHRVVLTDGRRLVPPPSSPQSSARSGRASRR